MAGSPGDTRRAEHEIWGTASDRAVLTVLHRALPQPIAAKAAGDA